MKAFISQPMRDRTSEEIQQERLQVVRQLRALYGDDVEILPTYFKEGSGSPIVSLGKSIEFLAQADVAIFAVGWEQARGCRIEHLVCEEYGIKILS